MHRQCVLQAKPMVGSANVQLQLGNIVWRSPDCGSVVAFLGLAQIKLRLLTSTVIFSPPFFRTFPRTFFFLIRKNPAGVVRHWSSDVRFWSSEHASTKQSKQVIRGQAPSNFSRLLSSLEYPPENCGVCIANSTSPRGVAASTYPRHISHHLSLFRLGTLVNNDSTMVPWQFLCSSLTVANNRGALTAKSFLYSSLFKKRELESPLLEMSDTRVFTWWPRTSERNRKSPSPQTSDGHRPSSKTICSGWRVESNTSYGHGHTIPIKIIYMKEIDKITRGVEERTMIWNYYQSSPLRYAANISSNRHPYTIQHHEERRWLSFLMNEAMHEPNEIPKKVKEGGIEKKEKKREGNTFVESSHPASKQ